MASPSAKVYKQSRRPEDNAIVLRLADPTSTKFSRMLNSLTIPDVLKRSRPLTAEEQEDSGFTMLKDEKVVMISKAGKKDMEIGFCRYLSPVVVSQNLALWNNLFRMQYILADPNFIAHMESCYPSLTTLLAEQGHTYNVGFTVTTGHRAEGIQ